MAQDFLLKGTNGYGVLLLHTLGGEPDQMKPLGERLNELGFTVYAPLYKGHGGDFTDVIKTEVSEWYMDCVKGMNTLRKHVEEFFVMGMSIGGTFAVRMAEQYDLLGVVTMNAPVIGFDLESDVTNFRTNYSDKDLINTYRAQRERYFHFVTEIGQTSSVKTIVDPLFVIQGGLDGDRYKTSSELLMQYASSKDKHRKDYANSSHLILDGEEKEDVINDIIEFMKGVLINA